MSGVVEMLPITSVGTKDRLRHDDHGWVEALAASIARAEAAGVGYAGLRNPIEVRREGRGYLLISGLHRLMALHLLERDKIAAVVLDVDAIEAQLLEVEENLVRRDLDALDRALFVLRFREMFEAKYGSAHGGDRKSIDFNSENQAANFAGWSEEAEDRIGLSERSIQYCLRIAKGLSEDDVERLRGTKYARNQSALLALCGVPTEKHGAVLDALFDEALGLSTMQEAIDHALNRKRDLSDVERFMNKHTSMFSAPKRLRTKFWREAITHYRDEIREAFRDIDLAGPGDE